MVGRNNSRNNNDNEQDDYSADQAHPHLHILPPHLFANSVGSTTEALSGDCKVVGLILKGIEAFTTLRDLVDILFHHTNGIIDLLRRNAS